jgi:hypothetical protein
MIIEGILILFQVILFIFLAIFFIIGIIYYLPILIVDYFINFTKLFVNYSYKPEKYKTYYFTTPIRFILRNIQFIIYIFFFIFPLYFIHKSNNYLFLKFVFSIICIVVEGIDFGFFKNYLKFPFEDVFDFFFVNVEIILFILSLTSFLNIFRKDFFNSINFRSQKDYLFTLSFLSIIFFIDLFDFVLIIINVLLIVRSKDVYLELIKAKNVVLNQPSKFDYLVFHFLLIINIILSILDLILFLFTFIISILFFYRLKKFIVDFYNCDSSEKREKKCFEYLKEDFLDIPFIFLFIFIIPHFIRLFNLIRLSKRRNNLRKLIYEQFILIFKDYLSFFGLIIILCTGYKILELSRKFKSVKKKNDNVEKQEDEIFYPYNEIIIDLLKDIIYDIPYFCLFILCLWRIFYIIFIIIKNYFSKNQKKNLEFKRLVYFQFFYTITDNVNSV